MKTFNIHEAKTHLSKIIEEAAQGETIIIAKAGKPVVKVVSLEAPDHKQKRRLGFMQGQIRVPEDFDRWGEQEIGLMFEGTR